MNYRRSRFFLAFALLLSVTGSVSAILDLDNNGSSDIWEEHYNATLPANEDPDGDGFTNKQEYDRGTHPLVKDSSEESITIATDPQDGLQSQFRFFGGIARTFKIEETTDLAYTPWSEAETVPGADTTILMEENLNSDKKFFRIEALGANPDAEPPGMGDNLDAVEEHLLGTDNKRADTDGDYLSDFLEASGSTSAVMFDSDGDGTNDGQALGYGQYWMEGVGLGAFAAIEAEVYVQRIDEENDNWRAYPDVDAAGDQALQSTSVTEIRTDNYVGTAGSARYRVYFTEPGNYYLWVRGKDTGGGDHDSVHMGLDNAVNQGVDQLGGFGGDYTWISRSYDGHRAVYGIATSGWHLLNLWIREPNVVIDQFLLTGDPKFVPEDRIYTATTSGADSDDDGLPDDWETLHGLAIGVDDSQNDSDGDGLTALEERARSLDPDSSDTDGDNMPDDYEIAKGFDPLDYYDALEDADGDEYPNVYEHKHGKDPLKDGFVDDPDYPVTAPPTVWLVDKRGNGDFTTITNALAGIDGDSYEIVELNEARNGLGPFDRYYLDSNGETFPLIIPAKTMIRGTTMEINSDGIIGTTIGSFNNNQNGQPYCILSDHSVLSQTSFQNTQNHDRSEPCILAENTTHIRISNSVIDRYRNTGTDGGAIRLINTHAIISGCSMRGNTSLFNGGQVAALSSTVSIRKSYLSHSVDSGPIPLLQPLPQKGGLLYSGDSTVHIESSSLTAGVARQGGCIYAADNSALQILNSRVMYAFGGTQVSGSIDARGGAMFIDGTSGVQADHVSLHSHKNFSGSGTTAYVVSGGQLTMTNCIDWENGGANAYQGDATITYSNIQGAYPGTGNISTNPDWDSSSYFPEDTLELNATSPCIDMGKLLTHVLTDFDGDLRPNGALPDMGADESDNGSSTDSDGDGLADVVENQLGINAVVADSDGDLLPDNWEIEHDFDPGVANTPLVTDTDGDGLSDWFEYRFRSDPRNSDTDTDEYSDLDEVMMALNPENAQDVQEATLAKTGHTYLGLLRDLSVSSDADILSDEVEEAFWGSNPSTDQTDTDMIPDDIEVRFSLSPVLDNTTSDSDEDGFTDLYEYQNNLLPNHWDTDGDRLPDKYEVDLGFNPRTLLDGLAAWWRMDGELTPVVNDHVAYLYAGRGHANLKYEDYRFGRVAVFDGVDAYIAVPHADVLNLDTDWSLSFWYWPESGSVNAEEELVWKHDAYRFFFLPGTGQIQMTFGNSISSMTFSPQQTLIHDQWNHVLIKWDGSTGALSFSVNHATAESFSLPPSEVATSGWPLIIGAPRAEPSLTPTGKIDDVRLYTKLLHSSEHWELAHPDDPSLEHNQDVDGDGLLEYEEVNYGTDRLQIDSDGDGLEDGQEVNIFHTHPNITDSDGDGLEDGDEVNLHNTDPAFSDSDDDGLSDGDEVNTHGTNPNSKFSDSDTLEDGVELEFGLDPLDETDAADDSDNDGVSNEDEITAGTNPNFDESIDLITDTDGDGLSDYAEINVHNTLPDNPESHSGLTDGYRVRYGLINPDGTLAGHPEWEASGNVDGDSHTNQQEEANGTSPTDPSNTSAVLIGSPIPVTESPQATDENDTEPHTFSELDQITFPWQPGDLVFLSGSDTDLEPLSVETEIVILDGNDVELGRVTAGKAKFDPAKHVGDSVENVYEFEEPRLLSEFLTDLQPDSNGELTLKFKFQSPKAPSEEDDDPGSGQPGSDSLESGGSGIVRLIPPDEFKESQDNQKLKMVPGGGGNEKSAEKTKETYSSSKVALVLLPCEIKYLERADPSLTWTDESEVETYQNGQIVYSDDKNGDFIRWEIKGGDVFNQDSTFSWSAIGPEGQNSQTISGPSGQGENTWELSDGGLDWAPGTYDIKCSINGFEAVIHENVEVGVRTQHLLAAGWIDGSLINVDPSGVDASIRATLNDPINRDIYLLGILTGVISTESYSLLDKIYIMSFVLERTANSEPPSDLRLLTDEGIFVADKELIDSFLETDVNYRLANTFQIEFTADSQGSFSSILNLKRLAESDARVGPTPNAILGFFDDPGEAHPQNGALQLSLQNGQITINQSTHVAGIPESIAHLNSGRVGSKGQTMNEILFERTTPYVFTFAEFGVIDPTDVVIDVFHEIFPTHTIYEDGELKETVNQSDPYSFVLKGDPLN